MKLVGELVALALDDVDDLRGERRGARGMRADLAMQAGEHRRERDGHERREHELGGLGRRRALVRAARQQVVHGHVAGDRRQRPQRHAARLDDERHQERDREVGEAQRRLRAAGVGHEAGHERQVDRAEALPRQQRAGPAGGKPDERERVDGADDEHEAEQVRLGGRAGQGLVRHQRDRHEREADHGEPAHRDPQALVERRQGRGHAISPRRGAFGDDASADAGPVCSALAMGFEDARGSGRLAAACCTQALLQVDAFNGGPRPVRSLPLTRRRRGSYSKLLARPRNGGHARRRPAAGRSASRQRRERRRCSRSLGISASIGTRAHALVPDPALVAMSSAPPSAVSRSAIECRPKCRA